MTARPTPHQPTGQMGRRRFLAGAGGVLASGAILTDLLGAHTAWANSNQRGNSGWAQGQSPWGPLAPVPDQYGVAHLALPPGFAYRSFSATGAPMADGTPTPAHHDGMRAFPLPDGRVRLIRNHEITASRGTTPVSFPVVAPGAPMYDPVAKGGTVTVDYDPATGAIHDFVSLAGTIYNCAGGTTLDGASWISCEETTHGTHRDFGADHGFCFLVPAAADGPVDARPIVEMGRFNHEAAVADPTTGIVYMTEDRYGSVCGFYRFVPNDIHDLTAGGTLQMLAVHGQDNYDTRKAQQRNRAMRVRWVTIDEPDAGFDDPGNFDTGFPGRMALGQVAAQGIAKGAAVFDRLEGAFASHDGSIFFVSTSGGDAEQPDMNAFLDEFTGQPYYPGYGQIWELNTRANRGDGILRMIYESPGKDVLDSPDNVTITPRGGLILCEDDTAWTDGDTHPLAPDIVNPNRLVGLAADGRPFDIAVQLIALDPDPDKGGSTGNEFAGATFSPDGSTLFVNLYGDDTADSGHTFAITGPWQRARL